MGAAIVNRGGFAVHPIERLNLALCAGVVALSALLASPLFTLSIAVGAILEAANFRALMRATDRLFGGNLQSGRAWSALFSLRFVALGAGMYAALWAGCDPIGLVLGLSAVVPAAVVYAWRTPPPPLPPGTQMAPPPDDPSWDEWNPWLATERAPRDEWDEDETQ